MIELQNVTKYFGSIKAVDSVTFSVKEGEILGLLGPNGAGKTTTMRMLTGFLAPEKGKITIGGYDVVRESLKARRLIGYLPEDVPLYKDATVQSFLSFAAKLKGVRRRDEKTEVEEALSTCGIWEVRKRIIGKLSKGFRQRVGLAQALIGNPKLLILDEPTSGLDPKQINEIRNLIRSLKGKQTILLSTHILPEVSHLADRVLIMNQGRVVASGAPEDLASDIAGQEKLLITVKGEPKLVKLTIHRVEGVLSVDFVNKLSEGVQLYRVHCKKGSDARARIAELLVDAGLEVLEFKTDSLSLEDVFLHLVTREDATDITYEEPLTAGEVG